MHNPALATLRDIHLPPPVSWFPPAPGWFLVMIVVLLVIFTLILWLKRWRRKHTLRQATMKTFIQLHQAYTDNPNNAIFAKLNQLLKQVALTFYANQHIEALTDDRWLAFLNETGRTQAFTALPGKQLIEAAYSQNTIADPNAIFALCRQWLRRQL